MKLTETALKGVVILEPKVFEDPRGYFFESYNQGKIEQLGLNYTFVQDNQSKSSYGVIRGLHYQLDPHGQTKLVRVLEGSILDVAVDIRKNSPTFGQWVGVELTAENKKQLLVPVGFAHGFSVLSPTAVVMYKCTGLYNPQAEGSIIYNDPTIGVDWQVPADKVLVSEKDQKHPTLENARMNFVY